MPPTDVTKALEAYQEVRALHVNGANRYHEQIRSAELKVLELLTPEMIEGDPHLFFWAVEITGNMGLGKRTWREKLGIGPESFFARFRPGDKVRAWISSSEATCAIVAVNPDHDQVLVVDELGRWDLWRISHRNGLEVWFAERDGDHDTWRGPTDIEIRPLQKHALEEVAP